MKNQLKTIIATLKLLAGSGIPSHILSFGDSLGDNLLLTTLVRALNQRGYHNIWIKCNYPELFHGNPSVRRVLPFQALLSGFLLKLFGVKTVSPVYTRYDKETDQDLIPEKHIILKMADSLSIKGNIENKPIFTLTREEEDKGRIFPDQVVIASSSSGAVVPMGNKEWVAGRYQELVDKFSEAYQFIQLGSASDTPLKNVLDLRGKTTIREGAAILKNARLLISHVGFLMHLARAVDCRSVIIYGGREKPWQSGYACFENISGATHCSPCWLHNRCPYEKKCMTLITTDQVAAAAMRQLALPASPLQKELLNNG